MCFDTNHFYHLTNKFRNPYFYWFLYWFLD
ncbi:hypothetical protein VPHD479_0267 [Vibrio phage D479]